MKKEIYQYICHEIARLRYNKDNLSEKLINVVKRKFEQKIEKQEIDLIIQDVNLFYNYASKNLIKFIKPNTTGYADPKFIKIKSLVKDMEKKFPKTDKAILSDIADWAMYWEYLR